jgi:hypothetical protein
MLGIAGHGSQNIDGDLYRNNDYGVSGVFGAKDL